MAFGYVKRKIKLNFLKEKPTRYKLMQLTYPPVTYEQLVKEVSESRGVNTNQTRSVVDALLNRLIHYMEIGHAVQLGSFGSFKPTFTVKAVKMEEDADTTTVKRKRVTFFPGKDFKNMLEDMGFDDYSLFNLAAEGSQEQTVVAGS